MGEYIKPHFFDISKEQRQSQNRHNSFVIWFTGFSGSGKSTIANILEHQLHLKNIRTYSLDGDKIRKGINNDLSFSPEDRKENIRRIGEVVNLMVDAGIVVLASFVSPYKNDREFVRDLVQKNNFVEVFVNTSVEECERRDPKGLYKRARTGEVKNLTGISSPYEIPENPDVIIETELETPESSAKKVLDYIHEKLEFKYE